MALDESAKADDDYPFTFACRRSGNCCSRPDGLVRLDAEDLPAISRHLQMSEAAFRSRFLLPGSNQLKDGLGGRCPFLEDGPEAACGIYGVRPQKCRDWPFWPELLDSSVLLAEAMRLCPGIRPLQD
ncbi:MAG: YkgJ family cysteine cluster protein [Planctomycetota bacterium]